MTAATKIFGILGILIAFSGIVILIITFIFGIIGLKTKQYGDFKKMLKIFGLICIAFIVLSAAWWGYVTYGLKQADDFRLQYIEEKSRSRDVIADEDPYDTFADESLLDQVEGGTTYIDQEFGFSLDLPKVKSGTFAIKKETYNDLVLPGNIYQIPVTHIRFTVETTGTTWTETRYDVFQITSYPRDWWDAHVTIDNDRYLLIDGLSDGIPFETFAGQNEKYAFTFSAPIDCLLSSDTKEEPWQCDVAHTAEETILQTIKVF